MDLSRMASDTGGRTQVSGSAKSFLRWAVFASVLIPVLLALGSIALAQGAPDKTEGRKPYKLPPNLLSYLKDKYVDVDEFLISTLQETPNGPNGHINLRGHIVPEGVVEGATPEERARGAARAFLREEAALLDIADSAELREVSLKINESGEAAVDYVRTIGGLDLLETLIDLTVAPDGAITRVHAALRPASPELYEAVARKTLARDEVIGIVTRDLASPNGKTAVRVISEPGRFATWRAPYVVWGVAASAGDKPAWSYTVDAFTGKVLSKSCMAVSVRSDIGSTPCD